MGPIRVDSQRRMPSRQREVASLAALHPSSLVPRMCQIRRAGTEGLTYDSLPAHGRPGSTGVCSGA